MNGGCGAVLLALPAFLPSVNFSLLKIRGAPSNPSPPRAPESTRSASEISLFTTIDRGYDIISIINFISMNILGTIIYQIGPTSCLRQEKTSKGLVRRGVLTTLPGGVDWFVCLYEDHSVSVAHKNLRFFYKLEMTVI